MTAAEAERLVAAISTSDPPQARRVILVRHARPRVVPERPAAEWELGEEGLAGARRLAALAVFAHAAGCYAGPEAKLRATLAPVAAEYGLTVQADPAFAESEVAGWLPQAEFLATAYRFLATPARPAAPRWEPAAEAAARFAAGIARLIAVHGPVVHPGHVTPGTFAVCSGGRVLSAYLAMLLSLEAEAAFRTWRGLRMPDIAVVELAPDTPPRLVIPFGALAGEAAGA